MNSAKSPDKKSPFQPILQTIYTLLQLPACIWLADQSGKLLQIDALTKPLDRYYHKAYLPLESEELLVADEVIRTGETTIVEDIQSKKQWKYKDEAIKLGLKSAIVAPLRVKDKVVGILDVYIPESIDFDHTGKKSIIVNFANQISSTIRKVRDLETLNEVSRLFSSKLQHPADLLESIIQSAQRVLECEHVTIFLMEELTGDLVLNASSPTPSGIQRIRFKPGEGLAGRVAQTGRSELISDVRNHPEFVPGLFRPGVKERSMLLVPIMLEKKVVGVISSDMDRLNGFDLDDQNLLEALAGQAAVAIHNAELFQQVKDKAQALTELNRLASSLVSVEESKDIRNLLEMIAKSAKDVLKADLIELYEYRQDETDFILPQISIGKRKEDLTPKIIYSDDAVFRLIQNPEPFYEEHSQSNESIFTAPYSMKRDDQPKARFVIREDIKSTAAIPLKTGETSMGLMFANYRTPQLFTNERKELIELFAKQASIAIQNTRRYYYVNKRRQALAEVGQRLAEQIFLSETDVLNLTYSQASKIIDMKNSSIALYDETTDTIHFSLAYLNGRRVDTEKEPGWEPRQGGEGKTERVIRNKKYVLIPTLQEVKKEGFASIPGDKYYKGDFPNSWLGVPMLLGKKVLGVLSVEQYGQDYFYNDDDIEILQALANYAAIAIENSRLYSNLDKGNKQQKALVEFGSQLSAKIASGEMQILEFIHDKAHQFMDTDNMYIALYDEMTELVRFGLVYVDSKRLEVNKEPGYQPRKAGKGKTEEIIKTQKPIFHATKAEAEAWYSLPDHKEYVGKALPSWIGVPMKANDKVIGVVATYHPTREYVYSKNDIEILQSMTDLAAIALENARLYEKAKKLHDEKVAAEQLATLGTAIAALQHRINNTFNIIVPNVTRLRSRVDMTDEAIVEILDIIDRNARQTTEIISRIQEPLKELEEQDVNINAVLDEVVNKKKEQWQLDSVKVVSQLDESIPLIRAPIGQVAEVFGNLIENAYRAMQEGGRLTIKSCIEQDKICIKFMDEGSGIPPDVQKRLFTKPIPSREPDKGAGLGLWLSQLILKRIGGEIKLEKSNSDGTTMAVQILLPTTGKEV